MLSGRRHPMFHNRLYRSYPHLLTTLLLASCVNQVDSSADPAADQVQALQGLGEDGGEGYDVSSPDETTDTGGVDSPTPELAVVAERDESPAPAPVAAPAGPRAACPEDMVEVQGAYCPAVVQECLKWIDKDHRNPSGAIDPNMCAEFRFPSRCISKRIPMDFCMDRYEWPNKPGEVPSTQISWVEAKASCEAVGKRLCTDEEFTLACEGPNMKPYPYGDGYHRDSSACNADQAGWIDPWACPFAQLDKRQPSGSHPACHSDYGVYDIVGNVDEWVNNTKGNAHHEPWVSGLMGGHWVRGVRNMCRAITDSHEPTFSFYVTGARCCSDPAR
jgi:hypothetical protein